MELGRCKFEHRVRLPRATEARPSHQRRAVPPWGSEPIETTRTGEWADSPLFRVGWIRHVFTLEGVSKTFFSLHLVVSRCPLVAHSTVSQSIGWSDSKSMGGERARFSGRLRAQLQPDLLFENDVEAVRTWNRKEKAVT